MTRFFPIALFLLLMFSAQLVKADYICFYLINSEIKRSMNEHETQKEMREKQLMNLSTETVNKEKWSHFKETKDKIQGRLNSVSLAIQAIPTSQTIVREINKIYEVQEAIYNELADAPLWIPIALQGQYEFVDKLQMNVRLIAGIVLSYGTINQMEKAHRKQLLDFAADEMKGLRLQSWYTLRTIRIAKREFARKKQALESWVNRDKEMVENIIKNAKNI